MSNDLYAKFEAGSAGLLLLRALLPKRFDWKLLACPKNKIPFVLSCDWLIDWLVVSALDVAEFSEFWETVCKKQEKGRFANLLIQKLVTQFTRKKSTKAKKIDQYSSDGLCVTAQGLHTVLPVYKCRCLCVCVHMLGFAAFTVKLLHTLRMIDQIFEFDTSDASKLQNIIMYYRKMVRQSNHIYHKVADRVSNLSPK